MAESALETKALGEVRRSRLARPFGKRRQGQIVRSCIYYHCELGYTGRELRAKIREDLRPDGTEAAVPVWLIMALIEMAIRIIVPILVKWWRNRNDKEQLLRQWRAIRENQVRCETTVLP